MAGRTPGLLASSDDAHEPNLLVRFLRTAGPRTLVVVFYLRRRSACVKADDYTSWNAPQSRRTGKCPSTDSQDYQMRRRSAVYLVYRMSTTWNSSLLVPDYQPPDTICSSLASIAWVVAALLAIPTLYRQIRGHVRCRFPPNALSEDTE